MIVAELVRQSVKQSIIQSVDGSERHWYNIMTYEEGLILSEGVVYSPVAVKDTDMAAKHIMLVK